jgi:hypothetical protein
MPGICSKLKDGRIVCKKCSKFSIDTLPQAQKLMDQVRGVMKEKLSLSTNNKINLIVTDVNTLKKKAGHKGKGMELGLYYKEEVSKTSITTETDANGKEVVVDKKVKVTKTQSIYILYGISYRKAIEVMAHELGHDWMEHYYPGIDELKIKEGWAEYVASLVNSIYGQSNMNKRMQSNPDPNYGAGYRMIKKIMDEKGTEGLQAFFLKNQKKK